MLGILNVHMSLEQVVALDMKRKLLPAMKELLNKGFKVQTLQAWGWFIRLIGPYAMKNRHLINEMLKIPEQTFSDLDPQIQIASQVFLSKYINLLMPSLYQSMVISHHCE